MTPGYYPECATCKQRVVVTDLTAHSKTRSYACYDAKDCPASARVFMEKARSIAFAYHPTKGN